MRLAGEKGRKPRVDRGAHLGEETRKGERGSGRSSGRGHVVHLGGKTGTAPSPEHQKLASASFSFVNTSNTVMSCVTVRTSLILGGRFTSFSFAPLCVAVV